MAIILSFYTGEQLCEDCVRSGEPSCAKCSPHDDEPTSEPPPKPHDRLVLDTVAE
jgi:hypothetical protein